MILIKKIAALPLIYFSLQILSLQSLAQTQPADNRPLYLKFPSIPQFSLIKQDGGTFTNKDLKSKPTLIFLFSVDCEHCHHETEELIKNIKKFKGTQILMVTYFPLDEMVGYYKEYNIQNYEL